MTTKATESQTQFQALIYQAELLATQGNKTLESIRLVRTTSYRAAKHLIWLQENSRDYLLKEVRKMGMGNFEKWLDKLFQPLTTLTGDNYHQLIDCIANKGMLEEEYRDKTPLDFLNEWREKKNEATRKELGKTRQMNTSSGKSLTPSTSSASPSVDYKKLYEESQRELKKVTRERDQLKRQLANLQKSLGGKRRTA